VETTIHETDRQMDWQNDTRNGSSGRQEGVIVIARQSRADASRVNWPMDVLDVEEAIEDFSQWTDVMQVVEYNDRRQLAGTELTLLSNVC